MITLLFKFSSCKGVNTCLQWGSFEVTWRGWKDSYVCTTPVTLNLIAEKNLSFQVSHPLIMSITYSGWCWNCSSSTLLEIVTKAWTMGAISFREMEGIIFSESIGKFQTKRENNLIKSQNMPPVLQLSKYTLQIDTVFSLHKTTRVYLFIYSFIFYCGIVVLQCHVSFCCAMKWISYLYPYIPSLLDFCPPYSMTNGHFYIIFQWVGELYEKDIFSKVMNISFNILFHHT